MARPISCAACGLLVNQTALMLSPTQPRAAITLLLRQSRLASMALLHLWQMAGRFPRWHPKLALLAIRPTQRPAGNLVKQAPMLRLLVGGCLRPVQTMFWVKLNYSAL